MIPWLPVHGPNASPRALSSRSAALRQRTVLALVPFALLWASPSRAEGEGEGVRVGDAHFAPVMELRTRGDYRHKPPELGGLDFQGQRGARVEDAALGYSRTRLGVAAERGPVRGRVVLQDARLMGSDEGRALVLPQGASTTAYEAFVEVRNNEARPSFLRLGRQTIEWSEGRLIGRADGSPTGRAFDALRGRLQQGELSLDAFASMVGAPQPSGLAGGTTQGSMRAGTYLFGLSAEYAFAPILSVQVFGLGRIARSPIASAETSDLGQSRASGELYTAGVHVHGDQHRWRYGGTFAYQLGNTDGTVRGGTSVAAYAANAHVARTFEELVLAPTFRVGGSYASGHDGSGGTYRQFDPMFADPFRNHGVMDLFAWSNLAEVNGGVSTSPVTDVTLSADYRYARLANGAGEWVGGFGNVIGRASGPRTLTILPVTTPAASVSEELGHEIDVGLSYHPWSPLELRANYGILLLGEGAKAIMVAQRRGAEVGGGIAPPSYAHFASLAVTARWP
jgi:hypothetical protein